MYIRITYQPSDAGWSCTYRSAQMLTANALGHMGVSPPAINEAGFGEWIGPVFAAHLARKRVGSHEIRIVDSQTTLREIEACEARLLLVPMRCGVDAMDPTYAKTVTRLANFPGFCGAVGGVGRRSYFVAKITREGVALCIDPHRVRLRNVDVVSESDLIRIPLRRFAPTICLGFLRISRLARPLLHHVRKLPLT